MKKQTILFLAANPYGTDRLALDREARAIQAELERSGNRDCFDFVTRWAVQPGDLLRELRKLKPTVVHFSGHSSKTETKLTPPNDSSRENDFDWLGHSLNVPQDGLIFQGSDGEPRPVSTTALQDTFRSAGSSVKLIVLNARNSDIYAEAFLKHVDCVIEINGTISENTAKNFAIGFYGGLGERESIAAAYQQGCAAISLEGPRASAKLRLSVRPGVDADHIILAADPM